VPRLPQGSFARLVQTAAHFARTQPALAGRMGEIVGDPSQERVREGLFFLGATVIDEVARFEADGHQALASIVAPDLQRPFPAATIVQLSVAEGDAVRVPAGAELGVRGDPRCRFRVASALEVGPARIHDCRVEAERRLSVRFKLTSAGTVPLARSVGQSLRIYIDEPHETALLLLQHLLSHTSRVELRRSGAETFVIGEIRPFGLPPADALAPEPDGVPTGASLIREYFLLPQKFLLFDLDGIAPALQPTDTKATIIFRFDAPLPQQVRVSPAGLRPHCTPAVNLFSTTAEPRLCIPASTAYPIQVAGLRREEASVYAVLGVSAKSPAESTVTAVQPARRFGAAPVQDDFPYVYVTKLSEAPDRAEPETSLILTNLADRTPVLEPHVVSATLLATNRALGAQVRPGELTEPRARMPAHVVARNIVPTSPYVPALGSAGFILRALVRGQVPRKDPLHVLQSFLYSLVPKKPFEEKATRALTARIDAIEGFDLTTVVDRERSLRGYRATFRLDESPFAGLGDVALFLRVLHQVLDAHASMNRFFSCEALCTKGGERLSWPTTRAA
jgi:type VI secretion system protein ImpG